MIVSLNVSTQSYITINNSRRRRRRVAKSVIDLCTVLMVRPYIIKIIGHGNVFVKPIQQLTTQMMTQTMAQQLTPYNLVIITVFVFVSICLRT